MNFRIFIPNFITSCNLFCGCLGVVCAFNQMLPEAALLIALAAVFDFFDGFVARLLGAGSELGGQLDSLADMVTFGFLPGLIMFQMISICLGDYFVPFSERDFNNILLESIGFIVAILSALRLAIFNLSDD